MKYSISLYKREYDEITDFADQLHCCRPALSHKPFLLPVRCHSIYFFMFLMQIMFPLLLFLQYVTQIITLSTFRAKKNGGREAQLVILSHYRGTPNTFTTSKPRPAAKGYKIAFEKSMLCSFDQHHQL